MSTPYAGNSASYPSDAALPDDGDARNASSVNVPFEAILDRTAWLRAAIPVFKIQEFTADGTWTAPAEANTFAIIIGGPATLPTLRANANDCKSYYIKNP